LLWWVVLSSEEVDDFLLVCDASGFAVPYAIKKLRLNFNRIQGVRVVG
jgi:hypothetical protein